MIHAWSIHGNDQFSNFKNKNYTRLNLLNHRIIALNRCYIVVSHGIAWNHMELHGITWIMHGIAWIKHDRCMEFHINNIRYFEAIPGICSII